MLPMGPLLRAVRNLGGVKGGKAGGCSRLSVCAHGAPQAALRGAEGGSPQGRLLWLRLSSAYYPPERAA